MNGPRALRRLVKIVFGFTLLGLGIVMIALPGPGWLTIAAGLAILAGEFVWARKLLDRVKETGGKLQEKVAEKIKKSPPERPDKPVP
jgi:tellurite resistance protein TerC